MARYIDADAFKAKLEELQPNLDLLASMCVDEVIGLIDEQPTAYDMDAVVAELEKESYQEWCDSPKIVELNYAIDIVRNAGKDGAE